MNSLRIIPCLMLSAWLTGCASSNSGEVYSRDQVRRSHTVQLGTVQSVKNVKIEGTRSFVGPAAGGVAGGVVGSTIGSGSGSVLAALGGAAIGAVGGVVAEEKITKKDGLEITVKLDSGSIIAVVQEADVLFSAGERVRVLTGSDGSSRVER